MVIWIINKLKPFVYVSGGTKAFQKQADANIPDTTNNKLPYKLLEKRNSYKACDRFRSKEITPTEAGKILYEFANNIINIRDNAVFTLSEFSRKIEGKVEIAASTVPAEYLLPKLMLGFRNKYDKISFSVQQLDSKQVIDELLERNFEFGIVGTKIENSKLEYKLLTEDKLVLAAPSNKKFSAIKTEAIPFEAIQNEYFIYRESGSGTRQEFEKIFIKNGINPDSIRVAARFNSLSAIKQAVSEGLGVSIMSLISIEDYIKSGCIKAFDIEGFDLTRAFYTVTHKKRPLSPVNRVFLEYILDSFS